MGWPTPCGQIISTNPVSRMCSGQCSCSRHHSSVSTARCPSTAPARCAVVRRVLGRSGAPFAHHLRMRSIIVGSPRCAGTNDGGPAPGPAAVHSWSCGARQVRLPAVRARQLDPPFVTVLRPETTRLGVTGLARVVAHERRPARRVDAGAMPPPVVHIPVQAFEAPSRLGLLTGPWETARQLPSAARAPLTDPPDKHPAFGDALERDVLVAGGAGYRCHSASSTLARYVTRSSRTRARWV